VPEAHLCCGRPLYDFGMLDTAEAWLRQILDTLRPQIQAGVPVVGMEPSCLAVFRDELVNLFPEDVDAQRLARQSFVLSEFLNKEAKDFRWPKLRRKALVHAHVVLGKSDGSAHGGHLLEAHVRPTLEVTLAEAPRYLHRKHDPESGLALIRL
jgi:Fe-S oxidoreductase